MVQLGDHVAAACTFKGAATMVLRLKTELGDPDNLTSAQTNSLMSGGLGPAVQAWCQLARDDSGSLLLGRLESFVSTSDEKIKSALKEFSDHVIDVRALAIMR
jgi:hypothetical protein